MKKIKSSLTTVFTALLMVACSCSNHPSVPTSVVTCDTIPSIYPDYCDVTVPCNIAPLNFMLSDTLYAECVARFTLPDGSEQTYGEGTKVIIPADEWDEMKQAALGKSLKVEVFAKQNPTPALPTGGGVWTAFRSFDIHISPDSIDPYISYRLIQPAYGLYDKMNISQRCVENFDESQIFNNRVACDVNDGQCINCHSYKNYGTGNMLFHVRKTNGGTIIVTEDTQSPGGLKVRKVNLKRPGTISAGVYPAWHPTEQIIAFSTNLTSQLFHTSNRNKVEVFDEASDLILYDIERDEVTNIAADTMRLEVFPTWSPDGRWLYYCSAPSWANDSTKTGDYRFDYPDTRYNLYRRSFDVATRQFGEEETVYQADTLLRSVSLPRISPDGRFLAMAEGKYGCFNIWHSDADIRILDLQTRQFLPANEMNSRLYAESYPSFSSNGRWLMCASRRDDGCYSRVYFAYFDGHKAHKAFLLPQADPEQNILRTDSYNRPEFMLEPVRVSIQEFAEVVKSE